MRVLSFAVAVLILPTVASAQAQKTRKTAAARRADTVRVVDTLRIADTVRVSDTVRVVDTMRVADTVRMVDTVRVIEPIRIADTVRAADAPRCSWCRDRGQQGRTILTFGLGLTGTSVVLDDVGQRTTHTDGQVAAFALSHYVSPDFAFDMAATLLDAEVSRAANRHTTSAVASLTFGLSYSPRQLALSSGMRPFVSAAVGPYAHIESQNAAGSAFTNVVSHVGGRFGAGMNMLFARVLAFRLEAVYDATSPFDSVSGATHDPSGFGITGGFGFGWGGR